jgi:hypothetical protein
LLHSRQYQTRQDAAARGTAALAEALSPDTSGARSVHADPATGTETTDLQAV